MKKIEFKWNRQNYLINENNTPFIVAEAGVNHNGNLKLAVELISIAKKSGADAIKFQSFITDEIATPQGDSAEYIKEQSPEFKSWYDLLKTLELSKKDHEVLIKECKKQNIVFFSTPYDFKSADMLENLGVPLFKIASTDTTNIPLIEYVATKGKPMIISTGLSTFDEVRDAVQVSRKVGNNQIIVLQCTANYPANLKNANIKVINTYQKKLHVLGGYSDHIIKEIPAILAVALKAVLFEKHFTKDRSLPGPDQKASAEPTELKNYVNSIREAYIALGNGVKRITDEEKVTKKKMQKSLTAIRDIKVGEIIKKTDVLIRRPASGMRPKYFKDIIGKKTAKNIRVDRPIKESDIAW